jgi:electron transport complex protein RnfC
VDGFLPTFTRRKLLPPTYREATWDKPVSRLDEPERVIIPLQDAPGTAYQVTVTEGEEVTAGQKIGVMGEAPACLSIHASISGTVEQIAALPHPLGFKAISLSIASNGKHAACECSSLKTGDHAGNGRKVLEGLQAMGIPLNYRHLMASDSRVSCLIINATEFEPYLTSRHVLLKEYGNEVAAGLQVLMNACSVKQAFIVVENTHTGLAEPFKRAGQGTLDITVRGVSQPYPDTAAWLLDEKFSPLQSNSKQGPSQGRVMSVDLSSLFAVNTAWVSGLPFTEQLITIAGSAIRDPQNAWVRTGTPLSSIITHAGGDLSRVGRVALGGPLMGLPQHTLDAPLINKAKGLFAAVAFLFDEHRESRFYKQAPCVKCAKCVDVCPASLVPATIADFINHKLLDDAQEWGVFHCVECGLCEYACPSRIPLLEIMRLGKVLLKGESCLLGRNVFGALYG